MNVIKVIAEETIRGCNGWDKNIRIVKSIIIEYSYRLLPYSLTGRCRYHIKHFATFDDLITELLAADAAGAKLEETDKAAYLLQVAAFQFNGYPEVIGEGNVTSVMSPDGSMQLLFLPTAQWWKPYPCNINAGYVNNTNWNPTGAWFIRSVFSPLQPMPCQPQPCQAPSDLAFHRTYSSNCCVNLNQPQPCTPPFELKFHNDICTSTSDIHYFYPNLRPCGYEWLQKKNECTSIQVDVPMVNANLQPPCEVICVKPCNCAIPMNTAKKTTKETLRIKSSDTSVRDMSCETDKSDNECRCQEKKLRKQKSKSKKKKNFVICECKKPVTTDKCVTTIMDQACGSAAERGCETQTAVRSGRETQTASAPCGRVETQTACGKCHNSQTTCRSTPISIVSSKTLSRKDAELLITKTTKGKNSQTKSGKSGCSSGSSSSFSDTDY